MEKTFLGRERALFTMRDAGGCNRADSKCFVPGSGCFWTTGRVTKT